jgi:hypothetical protein
MHLLTDVLSFFAPATVLEPEAPETFFGPGASSLMCTTVASAMARGTMFLLSFADFINAISVSDDRLKPPLPYTMTASVVSVLLFLGTTTTFAVSILFFSGSTSTFVVSAILFQPLRQPSQPPHISFQVPLDVLALFQWHLPSSSSIPPQRRVSGEAHRPPP